MMLSHRTLNPYFFAPLIFAVLTACSEDNGPEAPPLHFRDVTSESGLDMNITSGGTPSSQILEVKGGGLALIDFDNDGDLDLLVPNGATLESPMKGPGARLYENLGGMRFSDATQKAGLSFDRWGYGTAVGDYDGDGWDDIFLAAYGRNALLRNDGGVFREVTEEAGLDGNRWSTSALFGDVDSDGDLDLYVTNFLEFDPANLPEPMTFAGVEVFAGPMGLPAQRDDLFLNKGDGTFTNTTVPLGIGSAENAYGLGVVILDFDGDARAEIFVGNDSGENFLFWREDDGLFRNRGIESGVATNADGGHQATMGIAVGDVTGNGMPDLFTSNFMNDTNTLHANLSGLLFEDQTRRFGLGLESRPFLGWASMFIDFDHDGDEDLLIFNGHVYPETITSPHNWGHRQTPLLYERIGDRFQRVSAAVAGDWLEDPHCDRSAVFGDLDQDGDIDIVVAELNGPLRLLENEGARGDWLVVSLEDGQSANRRGLGSKVVATRGDRSWTRWIHGGGGYQSSNAQSAHFGFPPGEGQVDLKVTWPDGSSQTEKNVGLNHALTITRS